MSNIKIFHEFFICQALEMCPFKHELFIFKISSIVEYFDEVCTLIF